MVKLKDVARLAKVSLSTVSRVINGNTSVHPETRVKVEQAMAGLGYRPNEVARAMVTGRTMTIGLIVADITNPFYAEVARGVVNHAREHRYDVFLCNTDNDQQVLRHYLEVARAKHFDGIVCAAARRSDPDLEAIIDEGIPLVCFNRRLDRPDSHYVVVDNALGAQQAVDHLVRLGHTRIGFLSGPPLYSTGFERLEGFKAAMAAAGLEVSADLMQSSTFMHHEAYRGTMMLLNARPRPTAVFAANDLMALVAVECALENGLRVPEDLSVVGFDDIGIAAHRSIQLTTVSQRMEEMGRLSVQAMIQLLVGDSAGAPIQVVLRPQLRVRGTTGPAPSVS